jgi:hypothetical protein
MDRIVVGCVERALALSMAVLLAACGGGATGTPAAPNVASTNPSKEPTTTVASTEPAATPVVITPPRVAVSDPLEELWTYQGTPASYPWAPAIDPDGRIWVAALALNEFWVAIDPAGDRIYVALISLRRVRAYALPGS